MCPDDVPTTRALFSRVPVRLFLIIVHAYLYISPLFSEVRVPLKVPSPWDFSARTAVINEFFSIVKKGPKSNYRVFLCF